MPDEKRIIDLEIKQTGIDQAIRSNRELLEGLQAINRAMTEMQALLKASVTGVRPTGLTTPGGAPINRPTGLGEIPPAMTKTILEQQVRQVAVSQDRVNRQLDNEVKQAHAERIAAIKSSAAAARSEAATTQHGIRQRQQVSARQDINASTFASRASDFQMRQDAKQRDAETRAKARADALYAATAGRQQGRFTDQSESLTHELDKVQVAYQARGNTGAVADIENIKDSVRKQSQAAVFMMKQGTKYSPYEQADMLEAIETPALQYTNPAEYARRQARPAIPGSRPRRAVLAEILSGVGGRSDRGFTVSGNAESATDAGLEEFVSKSGSENLAKLRAEGNVPPPRSNNMFSRLFEALGATTGGRGASAGVVGRAVNAASWMVPNRNFFYAMAALQTLRVPAAVLAGGAVGFGMLGAGLFAADQMAALYRNQSGVAGMMAGGNASQPNLTSRALFNSLASSGWSYGLSTSDMSKLLPLMVQSNITNPNQILGTISGGMYQGAVSGLSMEQGVQFQAHVQTQMGLSTQEATKRLTELQGVIQELGASSQGTRIDISQNLLRQGTDLSQFAAINAVAAGSGMQGSQMFGQALSARGFQAIQMAAFLNQPLPSFARAQQNPTLMGFMLQNSMRTYINGMVKNGMDPITAQTTAQGMFLGMSLLNAANPDADMARILNTDWGQTFQGSKAASANVNLRSAVGGNMNVIQLAQASQRAKLGPLQILGLGWNMLTTRGTELLTGSSQNLNDLGGGMIGTPATLTQPGLPEGFFGPGNTSPTSLATALQNQKISIDLTVRDTTGRVVDVKSQDFSRTMPGLGQASSTTTVIPSQGNNQTIDTVPPAVQSPSGFVAPRGRGWGN